MQEHYSTWYGVDTYRFAALMLVGAFHLGGGDAVDKILISALSLYGARSAASGGPGVHVKTLRLHVMLHVNGVKSSTDSYWSGFGQQLPENLIPSTQLHHPSFQG